MKVGDYVHNVPYDRYGVIVDELEPIVDHDGNVAERRLEVLYDDAGVIANNRLGTGVILTGCTFLELVEDMV